MITVVKRHTHYRVSVVHYSDPTRKDGYVYLCDRYGTAGSWHFSATRASWRKAYRSARTTMTRLASDE